MIEEVKKNFYLKVYVTQINPEQAPIVIGTLIYLGATKDYIIAVLGSDLFSANAEETEKRNSLCKNIF